MLSKSQYPYTYHFLLSDTFYVVQYLSFVITRSLLLRKLALPDQSAPPGMLANQFYSTTKRLGEKKFVAVFYFSRRSESCSLVREQDFWSVWK